MIGIRKPAFGLLVIGGVVFASILAFLWQGGFTANVTRPYNFGYGVYSDGTFETKANATIATGGMLYYTAFVESTNGGTLDADLVVTCGMDTKLDADELSVRT